nr:HAD-IC family P-type ATPase [Patescibacteria group bacterium]
IIAASITFFLKKWEDGIVILLAVIVNSTFGYWEEVKVSKVLEKLKSVLKTTTTVVREGVKKEIFQEELVIGDLVLLKAGNKVPADGRIIKSENLNISEAILTGESSPSRKIIESLPSETSLAEQENMAFMGSVVESGRGFFIVTAIGESTQAGKIAHLLSETKEDQSPLQKKLGGLGKFIGILIAGLSILLFIGGLLRGDDIFQTFEAAVAIAVGGIPESLPVVMTVILAIGMERLLKKKGLIRKMSSVETLGSTSVICLDKTKTLTKGEMIRERLNAEDEKEALTTAVLCNEAYIENPTKKTSTWKINGSPTDKALLCSGIEDGILKPDLIKNRKEIAKIPFSSENKFQACLYKEKNKELILRVTGAPEVLLKKSKNKKDWQKKSSIMASDGLRVVGVAKLKIKEVPDDLNQLIKETGNLDFVGLIGFVDPLRKGIKSAIKKAKQAGILPVIITGDQTNTAKFVAKNAGINFKENQILEGKDLDKISDKELEKVVLKTRIYARTEPRHKIRIVSAWQKNDKVVAMIGDGVNDAPAIKKADIGLSLGSGTEIAKEASDMVLLNDSFGILISAIKEGRTILDNLRKSIAYVLSDSFASIIIVGAAKIIFGWPLPILPVQILWNNFMEDTFPTISYAFEPSEKDVMKRKVSASKSPLLTKEMKILIFCTGIIEQFIILLFFWILWRKLGWNLDYVRTLMFGAFALDTAFVVYSFKNLRKNIWQINPFSNKWLNFASLFSILAFLSTIYIPFIQKIVNTVPIKSEGWIVLVFLVLINVFLIEITKWIFISRHQTEE